MNEEDRKFLTEWGGDCWHEFDWAVGGRRCKKCGEWDLENRTFDTWEGRKITSRFNSGRI